MFSSDVELLVEDYVDGRLAGPQRAKFEERMETDPDLRRKVETATQSVELLRKSLIKLDPGGDFEEKVSSQIVYITQSNPCLRPCVRSALPRALTADDPDAKLLADPEATRERRRLVTLATVAAFVFAAAAATLLFVFLRNSSGERPTPAAPSAPGTTDTLR